MVSPRNHHAELEAGSTAMKSLLSVLITGILSVACYYGDPAIVTQSPDNSYDLVGLTADDKHPTDFLHVSGTPTRTTVSAPSTNLGGNTRIGFVHSSSETYDWNETCMTWMSHTGPIDQPGHVLRFDGTRAVTITQNIYAGVRSIANVHTWDLTKPSSNGDRFALVAQFTPPSLTLDWPLRSCGRAHGTTIEFKVWPVEWPEPAWGDMCCYGATTIENLQGGRPGWYAGHIFPGGELIYEDLYLHAI